MMKKYITPWLQVIAASLLSATLAHADTSPTDIQLRGTLTQGGLMVGKAPVGSTVYFNQRQLKLSPQGDFVFGFGRDYVDHASLKAVLPDGKKWQQTLAIEPREYRIQRVNGISKKIMKKKKSPETLARIADEIKQVKQARKQEFDLQAFTQQFIWPLQGPISGVYGSQRVYNGEPGRPHYGVDIAAPIGTKVYAPADGVVTLAHPDMFYSGGTLIIDHGHRLSSSFLHLSKMLVNVGDKVKQGDVIAEVGAGGRSTGAHLDWRMNWQDQRVDPQLLVPAMPAQ